MEAHFPSADEYARQEPRHPALMVLDLHASQQAVGEPYRNEVLSGINDACMRLAVFDGSYRWHCHPDSDELFLVVAGTLQIELADRETLELTAWQCVVIPAGAVHRTRAIGRTANITFEKRHARTVFVGDPRG